MCKKGVEVLYIVDPIGESRAEQLKEFDGNKLGSDIDHIDEQGKIEELKAEFGRFVPGDTVEEEFASSCVRLMGSGGQVVTSVRVAWLSSDGLSSFGSPCPLSLRF